MGGGRKIDIWFNLNRYDGGGTENIYYHIYTTYLYIHIYYKGGTENI